VIGHLLGHLDFAAVSQILLDSRGSKAVTAALSGYTGRLGPPSDHAVRIRLAHGAFGEPARAPAYRPEEITLGILAASM